MNLSELIKNVEFTAVLKIIIDDVLAEYDPRCDDGYQLAFNEIKEILPSSEKTNNILCVGANIPTEHDKDDYMYYVWGRVEGDTETYAMEFTMWDELLAMEIDEDTLDSYSNEEVAAAILYEMTFFGYTREHMERTVKEKIEQLEAAMAAPAEDFLTLEEVLGDLKQFKEEFDSHVGKEENKEIVPTESLE